MKKYIGIASILLGIIVFTTILDRQFFSPYNIMNLFRWTGLFGILSIGVGFVIMTGGIDLSVGSIVGFLGALTVNLLVAHSWPIPAVIAFAILFSMLIGFVQGLLVTKVKIQPFVVTLTGLFIFRGLSRFFTDDVTQGLGNDFMGLKFLVKGTIPADLFPNDSAPQFLKDWSLPMPFMIMLAIALCLSVFLNRSIYGRYILALGRNERAARFSGIDTDWMITIAYMISATCAGIGGFLFALDLNSVQPSTAGNMYELYAIAGCVVGGFSLRGGVGNITGVIIGVAIVRVLYNAINIIGIPNTLEYVVIGLVILIGVGADEVRKNYGMKKRLMRIRAETKAPVEGRTA